MNFIDALLNRITMYRLVLYYLVGLVLLAAVFGYFEILPYSPVAIGFSTAVILFVCLLVNDLFARVFNAQTGSDSTYITAFILALIISPIAPGFGGLSLLLWASVWAIASKFIFAYNNKHLFNPAAFGVALTALALNQGATWWVAGNLALLPFVVGGGLLIVRKIQRFDLVLSFFAVALVTIVATTLNNPLQALSQTLLHSSIFFLAFVMLTEPLTSPPTRLWRIFYGALVGFLFAPNVHLGSFYFTPELALLIGNIFVFAVSPKGRYVLTLLERRKLGHATYEFVFRTDQPLAFRAGQYLEWTVPHEKRDSRGNRRYFTIASSPTEELVRLGVRFNSPPSTFKRALWQLKPGDGITATQLAGDFTLPRDPQEKLAFIAGGIGITPFRSMIKQLIDTRDTRPVALLYANRTSADIAYKELFDQAQRELGTTVLYSVSDEQPPVGMYPRIDANLIATQLPDYRERTFYISGPRSMVVAFEEALGHLGVPRTKIKTDFFPGFA